MTHKILATLLLSTFLSIPAWAESLKSEAIKKEICGELVVKVIGVEEDRQEEIASDCIENADFNVVETLKDPKLGEVTGLKVAIVYSYGDEFSVSAEALTLKNLRPNKKGELRAEWFVSELTKSDFFAKEKFTENLLNKLGEATKREYSVERYDINKFSAKKAFKEMEEILENSSGEEESSGCQYTNQDSLKYNLDQLIDRNNYHLDYEPQELLKSLVKKGLIKEVLSRGYADGESESCLAYNFFIYTTDGWVLKLYFNYTT